MGTPEKKYHSSSDSQTSSANSDMSQSDSPLTFPIVRYIKPEKYDEKLIPVVVALQENSKEIWEAISEFNPTVLKNALDTAIKRIVRGGREHGNTIFLEKFRLVYDSSTCHVKELFPMTTKYRLSLGLRRPSESPSGTPSSSRISTPQRLLTPESDASSSPVRPRYVYQPLGEATSSKAAVEKVEIKTILKRSVSDLEEHDITEDHADLVMGTTVSPKISDHEILQQKPASPEKKLKRSEVIPTVVRGDSISSAATADTISIYPPSTAFTFGENDKDMNELTSNFAKSTSGQIPSRSKVLKSSVRAEGASSSDHLKLGGRTTKSRSSQTSVSDPFVRSDSNDSASTIFSVSETDKQETPKIFSNLIRSEKESLKLSSTPSSQLKRSFQFATPSPSSSVNNSGETPGSKRRRDLGEPYLTPKKRKFIIDQFKMNNPGVPVPDALLVKRRVIVQRPSIFGSIVSSIQNLFTNENNE